MSAAAPVNVCPIQHLGILSMFAAKSGAKAVYAVDYSEILEQAKQIVKDNGLDHSKPIP